MTSILMTPITGPMAWRGADLAQNDSWMLWLSSDELAEIDQALAVAKTSGRRLTEIGREHFPLRRMAARLQDIQDEVFDGRGFVVLRGLPVSKYSDEETGIIFWGLGRYLGEALYQNPKGDLLGHVYQYEGRLAGKIDVRGYETNAHLPYHTDLCDLIGLLCLRRAMVGGLSSLVSAVAIYNEILARHPEYLGLLYNGFHYIRREDALTERGVTEDRVPVFGHKDGRLSCRYIRNQINAGAERRGVSLTSFEREALDCFDALSQRADLRLDMDLQPGDIQFCNNYTVLHSRTEFLDGPEPHQKRHMLRLWLKFPKPWPVSADFPEYWGYRTNERRELVPDI